MFSNFHKLPARAVDKNNIFPPSPVTEASRIVKSQPANDPLKAKCVIKIASEEIFSSECL